jgi:carbon monoxide dehydrogenase subunit G
VNLTLQVDVAAPPQLVWEVVTDWVGQGDWMMGTRVRVLDDEPGVGQRIEAFSGVGRLGVWDSMTITRWEPPHRVDVVHTGRVIRGTGVFEVVPASAGSVFVWSEDLEIPMGAIGRAGWSLVRPAFAAAVQSSLHKMAAIAESRV